MVDRKHLEWQAWVPCTINQCISSDNLGGRSGKPDVSSVSIVVSEHESLDSCLVRRPSRTSLMVVLAQARRQSAGSRDSAPSDTKPKRGRKKRVKASQGDSSMQEDDAETKMKISAAAKISAARSLARKLSEEKAAAAAAAELLSKEIVDDETGKHLKQSVENEVANFAKEAGSADAAARMARKGGATASLAELEQLKKENSELQALLLQLARDREEAEEKLKQLPNLTRTTGESSPQTVPKKKKSASVKLLDDAIASAEDSIAYLPDTPIEVGSGVEILYNLAKGPLPSHDAIPVLKIGYNRWERIEKFEMHPVQGHADWYSVKVELPSLLFRVDFVIEDKNSGAVDNNNGQDFCLDLDRAPSAEEVTAQRVKLLDAFESKMMEQFANEEEKIYESAMKAATGAAKEAKLAFAAKRKKEILQEARDVVEERRGSSTEESPQKVFKWLSQPSAGSTSTLLYNKSSGALKSSTSVSVMVGYDSWWMQDTEAIDMVPASKADLPKDLEDGEWGSDYHSKVANSTPSEALVQLVFEALEASDTSDAINGEALAEKRVFQRASMKARASRTRRELQRKFLFTVPMVPQAGQKATVYYNPDRTVLRGRPDVFISGGFNRFKHPEKIEAQLMEPAVPEAGGLGFLQATIDIPADAHTLDLSFQTLVICMAVSMTRIMA
eukprot:jgi/Picre1/28056/NNA_001015.t1